MLVGWWFGWLMVEYFDGGFVGCIKFWILVEVITDLDIFLVSFWSCC